MNTTHDDLTDLLERMIDYHSAGTVLEALQEIFEGKSDHLLENWRDKKAATQWRHLAIYTGKLVYRAQEMTTPGIAKAIINKTQ